MIGRGSGFQKRRRNSRLVFIALFLLSAVFYLASIGNDESFKGSRSNIEGVGAKLLTYLTLPVRGFEKLVADAGNRWNAHSENERLKEEVSRLSDTEARLNALSFKLSRFETILNVDVGSDIPETKIAARAVSENDGPFAKTALINVGVKQGVSKGDAVMTIDGLYGHIIRVGNSSSRVLKLVDLNSRVAVISKSNGARAILIGDNSQFPTLSYISSQAEWEDGVTVMTSGDDGVLPMGLPIGTVVTENEIRKVKLFADRNFVDWVWVYPYEPINTPEEDPAPETTDDEIVIDDAAGAESPSASSEEDALEPPLQ